MSNMNGNDPNRILNECRTIDREIDTVEQNLEKLKLIQKRAVDETQLDRTDGQKTATQQVKVMSDDIIGTYQALTARVLKIKRDPESGNPRNAPQVGKIDRRLKATIQKSQSLDSAYRKDQEERQVREYKIVRPDASDAEVREAVEEGRGGQIFSQALINSDRRGQAQTISNNVRARHDAIEKIAQDFVILNQLFQDLNAQVIQQEPAVTQIEQRGEEVTDHVAKANTELDGAVVKARSARRKKWWCLLIVVLIIIVIAVVVAVAVTVTKK